MKIISEFIKSLGFTFSFRRLKKAILLVILFSIIGVGVYLFYEFEASESGLRFIYTHEVAKAMDLEDNTIIKIYKKDINNDRNQDFVFIMGKEQRSGDNALNSIVELYKDVEFVVIDGEKGEITKYKTQKEFKSDVALQIYEDEEEMYFLISDLSGNVELYNLYYGDVIDIIGNTTDKEFLGYTIYTNKDDKNSKLEVSLDNFEKEYLKEYTKTKKFDLSELGINLLDYRETYLRDRFSKVELNDVDNDGALEFVAYQYLLYDLDDTKQENKTIGEVKTVFEIKDNKLKFSKVEIKMQD